MERNTPNSFIVIFPSQTRQDLLLIRGQQLDIELDLLQLTYLILWVITGLLSYPHSILHPNHDRSIRDLFN